MRGEDLTSGSLFSYIDIEKRVPAKHPLRTIRRDCERRACRPSIPPEQAAAGVAVTGVYTIRSERQLIERLDFNILFRWFVGLGMDEEVWDAGTFCKNRDRLLEAEISAKLLSGVVAHKRVRRLLIRDHFSVDCTLIEAWASMKSFRPQGLRMRRWSRRPQRRA